ncbi:MAG TPA: hypothetical protein VGE07_19080, partial [Herpetosiphonaceae bacterium]
GYAPATAQGAPAPAGAAPACSGRVERPTKIVIDCQPGFATGQDQIEVYRRAPAAGADWEQALSYEDAVWIYKRGADAALIIDFTSAGGTVTAKLYDDQTGDARVAHQVNGDTVVITESPNPTVTATAEGGWWLPDGKVNYNLDLTIDGSLQATVETLYLNLIKNDGKTDYDIHVRDPNRNGHPDYEWRQVYPGLSEDDGFYHTTLMANTADDELPTQDSLFWPFVGSGDYGVVKNYRRSPPPLKIDWQRARFELVSEFVASRTSPSNFFIYSIIRIENGKLNDTNFESPFAFYSLGGPNQDRGFPDLTIRTVYYPAGNVRKDVPIQQIDWTWRHNDSGAQAGPNWDYRIGLFGRNEFVGQVDFQEFSVKITPYDKLPAWVVGNRWDYASFVARERPEYLTTEHIYEWSTLEGVVVDYDLPVTSTERVVKESIAALPDYVRGEHAQDISKFYRKIGVGLRGEFTPRLDAQPYVYISPVDAKLHLRGAAQGVWTLDPRTTITVANRDGDGYLDEWRYQRLPSPGAPLTVTRQLNIAPGFVLYGDDGQVVLRRATVAPSTHETLPPITNAEWAALGAELERAAGELLAPDDLLGMARRFAGQEQRIDGARLRGYRALPGGGFRFVLELDAGYASSGGALLGLAGLA